MAETAPDTDDPLIEIDAATLADWMARGIAEVIDVREDVEWDLERLPGSRHLLPLSRFDADSMPATDHRLPVLVCKVGIRSATAGDVLIDAGWQQVTHLAGGITAWKNAGLPVLR